jgi:hypothetical protein
MALPSIIISANRKDQQFITLRKVFQFNLNIHGQKKDLQATKSLKQN